MIQAPPDLIKVTGCEMFCGVLSLTGTLTKTSNATSRCNFVEIKLKRAPKKAARFMNNSQSEFGRRPLFSFSHICTGFQEQLSADQIKHDRQDNKWNQSKQIGMRPFKEGIVMRGPIFPTFELVYDSFFEIQERKHNAGECSARNVTRSHQYAGTFV